MLNTADLLHCQLIWSHSLLTSSILGIQMQNVYFVVITVSLDTILTTGDFIASSVATWVLHLLLQEAYVVTFCYFMFPILPETATIRLLLAIIQLVVYCIRP